jgi:hypothetical protein
MKIHPRPYSLSCLILLLYLVRIFTFFKHFLIEKHLKYGAWTSHKETLIFMDSIHFY